MTKLKFITVLIVFIPLQLISQNLVRNPSFENTDGCVENISNFNHNVSRWSTPTLGTTDLFNTCSEGATGIPDNFKGHQPSKFGEKYAGCFFYSDKNYREYVQGYFKSPLEKGKKYKVSFYISLGDKSKFAVKNIGFLLTKNRISIPTWRALSQEQFKKLNEKFLIYNIESEKFYDDRNNWTYVSKEITANGGENYVTIGNFQKNSTTKKKIIPNTKYHKTSYYYIDMVAVELLDNPLDNEMTATHPNKITDTETTKSKSLEPDENYIIENITFSFNSIEISESANIELYMIYEYLKSNKNIEIIISGHTDNIGSDEFNKNLSIRRANSVVEFLVDLGIQVDRIHGFGYGYTRPITNNKTEEGRNKNRRVEFKISTSKNDLKKP